MTMATTHAIPSTQRAFVVSGSDLKFVDAYPVTAASQLEPGQCLVKLTHSGVCHTDVTVRQIGRTGQSDLVGGHEGIGNVVAIGAHTSNKSVSVGDRVGIKYIADTCLHCEFCRKGRDGFCPDIKSSGMTCNGTFSEYAVAYVNHVVPIPEALESPAAAAIMCAGVTVYSALKQSDTHIGDWIVVPGAGGGLGHLAIQYAVAMGLRVVAIDTGAEKKKLALELGAEKWIDFRECADVVAEVVAATEGGAQAAIITTGSPAVYDQAALYLRPTGYIMGVGISITAKLSIPFHVFVSKGLTIRGIVVGNRQDSVEAVRIAASGKVKVHYTMRGLSELEQVFNELEQSKVVGRVVLDISK